VRRIRFDFSDSLLPETEYEVRVATSSTGPPHGPAGLSVTTPGIYLNGADLRGGSKVMADAQPRFCGISGALPSTQLCGADVYLRLDNQLYDGTEAFWRSGLRPVRSKASSPTYKSRPSLRPRSRAR